MSFKGLHYNIDRTLVWLNAESGGSSEKRSAVNAQYMCMEYSGLVFVYVGVCVFSDTALFYFKCLFGHCVLSAYIIALILWGYTKCTNTPFCSDQDFGNMTISLSLATGFI